MYQFPHYESAMINLYYALFYPHLMYNLEIWGHTYKSNINCIRVIQQGFSKIIDFSSTNYSYKLIVS